MKSGYKEGISTTVNLIICELSCNKLSKCHTSHKTCSCVLFQNGNIVRYWTERCKLGCDHESNSCPERLRNDDSPSATIWRHALQGMMQGFAPPKGGETGFALHFLALLAHPPIAEICGKQRMTSQHVFPGTNVQFAVSHSSARYSDTKLCKGERQKPQNMPFIRLQFMQLWLECHFKKVSFTSRCLTRIQRQHRSRWPRRVPCQNFCLHGSFVSIQLCRTFGHLFH